MYKNNILNLVLFIVVISLASIIYFSEETSTELDRLSSIDVNDINAITIQHNHNRTDIVKQDDGHWQITQPLNIAANDFRISSLLELLNAPVHTRYSVDEVELASIGLGNTGPDSPATALKLDGMNIVFGIVNPATRLRYIRLGETIYTIEDVYYPLISSNFSTLVSLKLLPASGRIEKLILLNQTISRDDKGFWQSNIDITADGINNILDHWKNDQAFGVHSYLEREQSGEIFVYLRDQQEPISFVVTDTDPWLILARPEIGLEYHLDIAAYDNLIAPR